MQSVVQNINRSFVLSANQHMLVLYHIEGWILKQMYVTLNVEQFAHLFVRIFT